MQKVIALFESDDATRDTYQNFLTTAGFEVRAYKRGHGAPQDITAAMPDLALLGVGPAADWNGCQQLCTDLRRVAPALPIVFLTAHDSEADKISSLRMGADDCISKDASEDYSIVRLEALIRRAHSLQPVATGTGTVLTADVESIAHVEPPDQCQATEQFSEGAIISDSYELERVLGEDDVSVIWLARKLTGTSVRSDADSNRVALKLFHAELMLAPGVPAALQRAVEKASELQHDNIAAVEGVEFAADRCFVTMEYLDGEPLNEILQRYDQQGFIQDVALEIIENIAAGLGYAHQHGVVHGGLQPADVIVTRDGRVKVLDFGVAGVFAAAKNRRYQSNSKGAEPTLFRAPEPHVLTAAYASCEFNEGAEPDVRDDVYSLACVAYHLLAGRHPFSGMTATRARDANLVAPDIEGLSEEQNNALRAALTFKPKKRTDTPGRLVEALRVKPEVRWPKLKVAAVVTVVAGASALLFSLLALDALDIKPAEFVDNLLNDQPAAVSTAGEVAEQAMYEAPIPVPRVAEPEITAPEAGGSEIAVVSAVPPIAVASSQPPASTEVEYSDPSQAAAVSQPQQQVVAVRARFDSIIAQPVVSVADTRELLADLETLEKAGAPVANGYDKVETRLLAEVTRLAEVEGYREAVTLARETGQILDSPKLQAAATELVDANGEYGRQQAAARITAQTALINDLLAYPRFNEGWDAQLWQQYAELTALPGAQSAAAASASQIASVYAGEARRQRIENGRLDVAREYLEDAKSYDPGLALVASEEQQLAAAMIVFDEDTELSKTAAEIAQSRQSFSKAIQSRDIREAERLYAELASKLPASDPFIASEAPAQLASVYVTAAEYSLSQGRDVAAEALVNQALKRNPTDARALEMQRAFAQEKELVFGSADKDAAADDY